MAKTKPKRLLCLLLSLAMVFALVITPVYADGDDGTDDQGQVEESTGEETEDVIADENDESAEDEAEEAAEDSADETSEDSAEETPEEDEEDQGEEEAEAEEEVKAQEANAADTPSSETSLTEADSTDTTASSEIWDGSVATSFDSGSGTLADPYIIANGAQLAYLSEQVRDDVTYDDCYFQLGADIDLNDIEFMPIGGKSSDDTTHPFKGNFNGNDYTISNLKITVVEDSGTLYFSAFDKQYDTHGDMKLGLFGYTYGDLKNFTINNVSVDGTLLNGDLGNGGSGGATSAVLGNTKSSAQIMENIHVTGNVSVMGNKFVGGIMGYNGTGVTYTNCSVSGNVTIEGNCYVGGIVGGGICNSAYNTTFTNCSVGSSDSTVQISGYYCVGGISGAVESSDDSKSTTTMTNCSVIGDSDSYITCLKHDESTTDSTNLISNYFVGGLSGKFGWGSGNYDISGCTVEIDVNGSGAYHSGHQGTSEYNTDHLDIGAAFVGYTTCTGTITNTSYTGNAKVAYAFKQYSNDDITMNNVKINSYVASIGDTKYTSLADAFSAATDGCMITMLGDVIETGATYNGDGYYQVSGKEVTLDLGGYTLSVDTTRILGVKNGGTLNVENGTVEIAEGTTATYNQFNMVRGDSTFTATDVMFNANNIGGYAVYIASGAIATVEMTNCTFTDLKNAVVFDADNASTVTLTGCSYAKQPFSTSTFSTVKNYTVVITENSPSDSGYEYNNGYTLFFNYVVAEGGTISSDSTVVVNSYFADDASLTVDGGTVNANIKVNDDTSMTVNGGTVTGTITVVKEGATGEEEEAVLLMASAEEPEYTITGGCLTITGGTIIGQVKSSGTLIMTGGTVKDDGETGYADGVIYILNGNVYVKGGTVIGTKRGFGFAGSGEIGGTITGGTITGSDIALMVRANTSNTVKVSGGSYTATNALYLANGNSIFADGYSAYNTAGTALTSITSGDVTLYKSSLSDKTVEIKQAVTLGGSSNESTSVSASISSGYGTNTLYVAVSASDVAGNYSTENYPTTSLAYTGSSNDSGSYIFAGWYTLEDGSYTACTGDMWTSTDETTYYARFVDANALRVICVYTPDSLSATGKNALRFLSSMDSLDFLSFNFVVNDTSYACTGYANSCTVANSSMNRKFTKADISSASNYLMTYRIYEESLTDTYSVHACWGTCDGTKVSGETLTISSSELTEAKVLGESESN